MISILIRFTGLLAQVADSSSRGQKRVVDSSNKTTKTSSTAQLCREGEFGGDTQPESETLNTQSFGLALWKLGWVGHIKTLYVHKEKRCCR
jgi:hypothetical protein